MSTDGVALDEVIAGGPTPVMPKDQRACAESRQARLFKAMVIFANIAPCDAIESFKQASLIGKKGAVQYLNEPTVMSLTSPARQRHGNL